MRAGCFWRGAYRKHNLGRIEALERFKFRNCVSAWNKAPVSGVIGVETGPH